MYVRQSARAGTVSKPDEGSGVIEQMQQTNRWNRTRYRLYAPIYDLVAKPLERGRKRAIERLDLEPGDRVLCLGCGTGADLAHFPADVDVTAVDITPSMVERTRARGESIDIDVDARVGDAAALEVPDDTFDAVTLHLVLSVVPDPHAVVAETERVLAPDGRVSIYDKFVPAGETPSLVRRALNPFARILFSDTTRSLEPLFAETDLELGERESYLSGLYTVTTAAPSGGG